MRFDVWAPRARAVTLETDGVRQSMRAADGGWWSADVADAEHGTDYGFRLDDGPPRPDPRSRWQPHGVHGPSRAYDHSRYAWSDGAWRGRALPGSVVYECHVGTFTPEGTLDSAIDRLDHLVNVGIDLIELLPLAAFDGEWGWGYDGAALWAVHEPYGGPDALKRFVDACHLRGIGVILDVVYNHLGPSGNYLAEFGPYFTAAHRTPWGDAVNLDGPGSDDVRDFIVGNALSWLTDFHLDGLRLDAIHALHDETARPLLEELTAAVDARAAELGRPLCLIAESDRNDPRTITSREAGGLGMTAQWSDDVHHAIHALLTGERAGYYTDFGSIGTAAKALTHGFALDGGYSTFRKRRYGRPVDRERTPGHRFVAFVQDHDQIGNRATGDRLGATLDRSRLAIAAALLLTSPYTPMLFMGEEWAASTPWQYFTSFPDDELGAAVSEGRRREFADHGWTGEVPDPQDPETYERSRLDWAEPERSPHREMLDWYRTLIGLRRQYPALADPRLDRSSAAYDEAAQWLVVRRGEFRIVVNLAAEGQQIPVDVPVQRVLVSSKRCYPISGGLELDAEAVAIVSVATAERTRP